MLDLGRPMAIGGVTIYNRADTLGVTGWDGVYYLGQYKVYRSVSMPKRLLQPGPPWSHSTRGSVSGLRFDVARK